MTGLVVLIQLLFLRCHSVFFLCLKCVFVVKPDYILLLSIHIVGNPVVQPFFPQNPNLTRPSVWTDFLLCAVLFCGKSSLHLSILIFIYMYSVKGKHFKSFGVGMASSPVNYVCSDKCLHLSPLHGIVYHPWMQLDGKSCNA